MSTLEVVDSLVLVSDAGGGLGQHRIDVVDRCHLIMIMMIKMMFLIMMIYIWCMVWLRAALSYFGLQKLRVSEI